jgi:thioredoxin-like negative regulator of GroEL
MVALVDAADAREVSSRLEIAAFPSIIYIDAARGIRDPYEGPRDLDSLATFVERMLSDPVGTVPFEAKCDDACVRLR